MAMIFTKCSVSRPAVPLQFGANSPSVRETVVLVTIVDYKLKRMTSLGVMIKNNLKNSLEDVVRHDRLSQSPSNKL
jgi:hypothetical protein